LSGRDGVRPTESKVREALIDRWRPRLSDARVLDLFAGTGAVGLNALSCGAASCLFVDRDRTNLEAIASLSREWGISDRVHTCEGTLPEPVRSSGFDRESEGGFDLIFADPPYLFDPYEALVAWAAPHLADGGELVIEHSVRCEVSVGRSGLQAVALKRYGECALSVFEGRPENRLPHSDEATRELASDSQEEAS